MHFYARVAGFFVGVLFSLSAFSAAILESVTGSVRAGVSAAVAKAVRKDQRLLPGTMVVTGPRSGTTLRFDDGQAMVLGENTEFRIVAYRYAKADPKRESYVFELFKGALRSISGLLASRSPQAFALRVPQATIGIRGTDFMVAVVNPAYMSVLSGTINVSNVAGAATFGAGATAAVPSASTLAAAIPAAALPASVAATFQQLAAAPIAATGAEAVEAAAGGITGGAAAAVAAGVAAAAAAAAGDDAPTATGTGPSGTVP